MIVFYAMGGGFGHLTRVKTFIKNTGIASHYKVICSHPKRNLFFTDDELIYIPTHAGISSQELRVLIQDACAGYDIDKLFIDTFPCGILGELTPNTIKHSKSYYLARRMNWSAYQPLASTAMRFEVSYCFEELSADHLSYIYTYSRRHEPFKLNYPKPTASLLQPSLKSSQPIWLIIHTTHKEELEILISHAQDIAFITKCSPRYMVFTDVSIALDSNFEIMYQQQPADWYPYAEKIFSAAGFNTWYQLTPWREKHNCIPFKRKYDDQFWRSNLGVSIR